MANSKKTETVTLTKEEHDALLLKASKASQSIHIGFRSEEPDSYVDRNGNLVSDKAKGIRTLESGSTIVFKVSPNGWLSILPDFIPPQRGKSPRPGFGGYMNRHRSYAAYFRSKDYIADLAWCTAHGAKDAPSA